MNVEYHDCIQKGKSIQSLGQNKYLYKNLYHASRQKKCITLIQREVTQNNNSDTKFNVFSQTEEMILKMEKLNFAKVCKTLAE